MTSIKALYQNPLCRWRFHDWRTRRNHGKTATIAGGHPRDRKIHGEDPLRAPGQRISVLHPKDLGGSKEKLFLFLTGWLGGPSLYVERYGHPRLRARHLPFAIAEAERDQWMLCMSRAMEAIGEEGDLRQVLETAFFRTADFMRNRPPARGDA